MCFGINWGWKYIKLNEQLYIPPLWWMQYRANSFGVFSICIEKVNSEFFSVKIEGGNNPWRQQTHTILKGLIYWIVSNNTYFKFLKQLCNDLLCCHLAVNVHICGCTKWWRENRCLQKTKWLSKLLRKRLIKLIQVPIHIAIFIVWKKWPTNCSEFPLLYSKKVSLTMRVN